MAQTNVSVRMDEGLKEDFDLICSELGMTMSTAITMLAKKMTREKRLPFEASIDPFYSPENIARLRTSVADPRPPVTRTMAELEAMADD